MSERKGLGVRSGELERGWGRQQEEEKEERGLWVAAPQDEVQFHDSHSNPTVN